MPTPFRHFRLGAILGPLMPFFATLLALLVGAVMLLALDANPLEAYGALVRGAFGSRNALADTVVKATPLLFVGLGICIAFRGGVVNIGGEGQLITGAVAATAVAGSWSSSAPKALPRFSFRKTWTRCRTCPTVSP